MRKFFTYLNETLSLKGMTNYQRLEKAQQVCKDEGCGNIAVVDLDQPFEEMQIVSACSSELFDKNKYLVLWQALRLADGTYTYSGALITTVAEYGLAFEDACARQVLYKNAQYEYTNQLMEGLF